MATDRRCNKDHCIGQPQECPSCPVRIIPWTQFISHKVLQALSVEFFLLEKRKKKKKKKKTENGRNKVLKVCYASLSLSVRLSDILTPQVSFREAWPHCQPLCNRQAKSTRHSQQRKRRLSLKSIRLTRNARPLDCALPPSQRSTTSPV